MKGIYITDILEATKEVPTSGVGKKIQGQIRAMEKDSIQCSLHCLRTHENTLLEKILMRFAVFGDGLDWSVTEEMHTAQFLYIRRPSFCSRNMIAFLRKMRRVNPTCRLLLEIPTYPYDIEYRTSLFWIPLLWQDRFWRRRLKSYVDRIVALSNDREIFGIPTIHMENGVDLDRMPIKKQNKSNSINLCCAAQFSVWHGIDRLLRGLAEYERSYGEKREIHLYLAGEGPQSAELKKLTESLDLQNVVTFCGRLTSRQLYERLFDRCDLGVESLRKFCHPQEVVFSTLKSREYLAAGLPFLYEGKVDVFEQENVDFCFQVPSDETPVDIRALISFYDSLLQTETKEQLSKRIRIYAQDHVSWDKTFAGVVRWLKQSLDGTQAEEEDAL